MAQEGMKPKPRVWRREKILSRDLSVTFDNYDVILIASYPNGHRPATYITRADFKKLCTYAGRVWR